MPLEAATTMALTALAFLAAEPPRFERFLALTGLSLDRLRADAANPYVLAAVLEHLLADESLLLVFAADSGLPPEDVAKAHQQLSVE